ncbi:sulfonate ABC transporter substrate-binding protein [Undibacterium terreum]|uniref:Putative aliphatic sulfonates-binding protein n=1 Tax=Undibacterium terreum TaxID=1224302 RepID=A0A916V074_9BURK|nr:sulfonate ABC transporter substrate-binding protein [Undibacterium terreum]GGC97512.1 sulfonate ABC transporter substrate-binding protein [Undibacterium terreum]
MKTLSPLRRSLLLAVALALTPYLAWAASSASAAPAISDAPKELRIGFQKSSVNLTLLKQRQALEKQLKGTKVTWFEFTAGPQMLEALSVGSIDFATTGEPPPIFAQAAGSGLVYVGAEPAKPAVSAILVKPDSVIKSLADLKGKKIAFQKGSSAHYHVLRAVQQAGLQWSDISPIYLAPADARAAFERGSVDAWAIWDPYWAAIEQSAQPRVLATGKDLVNNLSYYLSSRSFAEKYPQIIHLLFEELTRSDNFVQTNRKEAIAAIAASTGLDQPTISAYLTRRPRSPVVYLTQSMLEDQQRVADNFFQQKLIPRQINVRDAAWLPPAASPAIAARN